MQEEPTRDIPGQMLDKAGRRVQITYRPISELKLDPKNPRAHSPRQVRQIARSIEAFGFNVPVLVDAKRQGDRRPRPHPGLPAARLDTKCRPSRLDHLSEAQARAFMIADNRLTENSTWDDRLLAEQLKELSELDLDFSLEVTGFEMGEIDLRIEGLAANRRMTIPPMFCLSNSRGRP